MDGTATAPDAPVAPAAAPAIDPSTITSLADYEAARPQLLKDTTPSIEPRPGADATREALLRDERGRFARQSPADPAPAAEPPSGAPATPDATAEELASPEGAEPETTDAQPPARKRTPEQRIAHVTWEREEARREAAALREQLEQLTRQSAPPPQAQAPQAPPQAKAPSDPEPRLDQFDTYEQFTAAQARWAARQVLQETLASAAKAAEAQQIEYERAEAAKPFAERMKAAREADPDLLSRIPREVLAFKPSISLGPGERPSWQTAVADALLISERPAELMERLTPSELQRLSTLHPIHALREIAFLEARLATAPTGSVAQPPPQSQAKPPIQPVGSGASAPRPTRDPKAINSLSEYEAARPHLMREFGGV